MKLGVIGGLGPQVTAYYYELLVKMTDVERDQDHLEVIIHSCPQIPDRTEYILQNQQENPLNKMKEVAQGLENQGVDLLVIPCITAHYFYHELITYVHKPIIHLVEEIAHYLKKNHIQSVGIMATTGTISTLLFQNELKKYDIKCIIPSQQRQEDVMKVIYDGVKKGQPIDKDCFYRTSEELFEKGAELIILGCTELSIVNKEMQLDERYLDALELLAATALFQCHIKIKEEYQYLVNKGD